MRLILFIIAIVLISSCVKEECQFPGTHEFLIPGTLTPALDTYRIGDTIFFSSVFDDHVYERKTNEYYYLEDFKFNPLTILKKIDTITTMRAYQDFDIIIDEKYNYHVNSYSSGFLMNGKYYYKDNTYRLMFKLVSRKEGLYLFQHGVSPYLNRLQTFDGMCPNKSGWIDGYTEINEGADNNIEFLHYSPDSHYNHWYLLKPEERFHDSGGYCFYVKE